MPFRASLHAELPIVEIRYSDVLTAEELCASAHESISLALAHGRQRILADCTDMVENHSAVSLYATARSVISLQDVYTLKEAVIYSEASASGAVFWETVCVNRGLTVRCFRNRQEALDWLLG